MVTGRTVKVNVTIDTSELTEQFRRLAASVEVINAILRGDDWLIVTGSDGVTRVVVR